MSSRDEEFDLHSEEARLARKLNYQAEADFETIKDYYSSGNDANVPDELDGKGTILIDGERVKWTRSRGNYRLKYGRYYGQTIVGVNNWRERPDRHVIEQAITDSLYDAWEKQYPGTFSKEEEPSE
jgi:hypothetical protein